MQETLAIILPAFNEEANIAATVSAVRAWMEERRIGGEIIVVNDGSTDSTGEILRRMQIVAPHPNHLPVRPGHPGGPRGEGVSIRIITHPENLGYGAAVRVGCDAAEAEWIGFMDSDGQFDPRDFERLLVFCHPEVRATASHEGLYGAMVRGSFLDKLGMTSLAPHHDKLRTMRDETSVCFSVVVGRRRKRADPFLRKVNAKLFGILSFLVLGVWVRDVNCAMKIFRRDVWRRCRPTIATGALFNAEFFYRLRQAGIPWKQVDVAHYPRRGGRQTGAKVWVIARMFRELLSLRRRGH